MRCAKAAWQLQLYLDEQLSVDEVRELEKHLASCSTCQEELFLHEELVHSLRAIKSVAEPSDLTISIMRRVARSPRRMEERNYRLLQLSLLELCAAIFLATITTLGIIVGQPPLRHSLPFANSLDTMLVVSMNTLHTLLASANSTIVLLFWIFGTLLGICITLMVAGSEMRSTWYKAMLDRLSVW